MEFILITVPFNECVSMAPFAGRASSSPKRSSLHFNYSEWLVDYPVSLLTLPDALQELLSIGFQETRPIFSASFRASLHVERFIWRAQSDGRRRLRTKIHPNPVATAMEFRVYGPLLCDYCSA